MGEHPFNTLLAGRTDHRRGGALALAEALAAQPDGASTGARRTRGAQRAFQCGAKLVCTLRNTGNIVTDVGHDSRTRLERKHSIEGRHTMNFRGGRIQPRGDVVESARANPADAVLDRVEHGEKAMARAAMVDAEGFSRVHALPPAALPARFRHTEFSVNSGAFFRGGLLAG